MNSNDFIFSDDVAESLGSRMADADRDADSGESGDVPGSGKAGSAAIGGVGLALVSLLTFWDRHPPL